MESPSQASERIQFQVQRLAMHPSPNQFFEIGVPEGFEALQKIREINHVTPDMLRCGRALRPKDLFDPNGIYRSYSGIGIDRRVCNAAVYKRNLQGGLHGIRVRGDLDQLSEPDAAFSLASCNKDGYMDGVLIALHCLGATEAASAQQPLLFTRDSAHVNLYTPSAPTEWNLDSRVADCNFLERRLEEEITADQLYEAIGKYGQHERSDSGKDNEAFSFSLDDATGKYVCYECTVDRYSDLYGRPKPDFDTQVQNKAALWYGHDDSGALLHPKSRQEIRTVRPEDRKHVDYGKRLIEGLMTTLTQLTRSTGYKPFFVTFPSFCVGSRRAVGGYVFFGEKETAKGKGDVKSTADRIASGVREIAAIEV